GHNIELKLWNDPAATAAANLLCDTMSQALKTDSTGHFSLTLGDDCTTGIGANKDTYVDVLLDGNSLVATRTKLGAVPYAVEAGHATSADNATTAATANAAGGTLKTTIDGYGTSITQIQSEVHAASGFHATLSTAMSIPNNNPTQVAFNNVDFDSGSEYNATTGTFTAKQGGTYLIFCGCEYSPTVSSGQYWVQVNKNGGRISLTEFGAATTNGITPESTTLAKLAANDTVTCLTGQVTGAAASLYFTTPVTQFGAVRLY
ncbi:MAG TPA: hypothetical protein VGI10_06550, partial [Polyangiaceae bacterium]